MNATWIVRPQIINLLMAPGQDSYSFDRAGRLYGAFIGGRGYRRALDNRILARWRGPAGRQRGWLPPEEAQAFLDEAYRTASKAASGVRDLRLNALQRWSWQALEADAADFGRVYRWPVSILPPDQYLALVVQATEGCPYNHCTYCGFYQDRPYRLRGPRELRDHIAEVVRFFGAALGLRRSLFLADASALTAPMPQVCAWLEVIEEAQLSGLDGICSFIDAFSAGGKSEDEWRELARRGLRRVSIGLESGDEALLRFLRKQGSARDAVAAVARLKAAGIRVGVIVMIGAGGALFAAAHVEGTVRALREMKLGAGDIVYLSPLVDHAGSKYAELAREAGICPLSAEEIAEQEAQIRAALGKVLPAGLAARPQFARYDIREFVY